MEGALLDALASDRQDRVFRFLEETEVIQAGPEGRPPIVSLKYANLRDLELTGKQLLRGADPTQATLTGADLTEAHLEGADLPGAHLGGADLTGAYLMDAKLSGAYLYDTDLGGADLSEADLSDAGGASRAAPAWYAPVWTAPTSAEPTLLMPESARSSCAKPSLWKAPPCPTVRSTRTGLPTKGAVGSTKQTNKLVRVVLRIVGPWAAPVSDRSCVRLGISADSSRG